METLPEYSTVSLLSNSNAVRLSMIALANIISAAPQEDEFGVTLTALPKLLKILTNITKGLDRLTRNNHQRYKSRPVNTPVNFWINSENFFHDFRNTVGINEDCRNFGKNCYNIGYIP